MTVRAVPKNIKNFAAVHDDLPAFHAAYVILALLLAAMVSIGMFGVLIALHMALDVVKYRSVHACSWRRTAEGVFRESLTDITLFLLALTFGVYLHHSISGIASLGGIHRAELTLLRAAGTVAPKFGILDHVLQIFFHVELYLAAVHSRLGKRFTSIERLCVLASGTTLFFLVVAPYSLAITSEHFATILADQLVPWSL
jgi:hypothetical protein